MYEIEVKVRADHANVRDRLADLGAENRGTVVQADAYYDHPSRSFAETDEALRVRREVDDVETAVLTYKGPLVEEASKTREEIELGVDDPAAMEAILESLGFEPVAEVRKERERYWLGGYTVTLDRVEGLGEFVEVETEGSDEEIGERREGAYDLLSRLGLDPEGQLRTSYLGLLLADE